MDNTISNNNDTVTSINEINVPKLPEWINNDYIKTILQHDGHDGIEPIKWHVRLAHGKGENYASTIYRIQVTIKDEDDNDEIHSYILKAAQGLEWTEQFQGAFNIFEKEFEMYGNVLPAFHEMLREHNDNTELSPRCILALDKPFDHFVFEDLSAKGYRMGIRQNGLDLIHMKLILKKLAKFHAISACYREKNGPYKKCLLESMYKDEARPFFEQTAVSLGTILSEVVREKWDNGSKYAELMNSKLNSFDVGQRSFAPNPDTGFNVLNHGDLWTNNAMFKYDDTNTVQDVLFIDFQMSIWSSPAIDLWYFIISSGSIDLKTIEFDTLIHYYHQHLCDALTELDFNGRKPTLVELHCDLFGRQFLGLMTSMGVLPIAKLSECENADINNFFGQNEEASTFKRQLYGNPTYVEEMNILMPFFEKRGY